MALINCSECSKEISDKASSCPHCGAPVLINKTATEAKKQNAKAGPKTEAAIKIFKIIRWSVIAILLFIGIGYFINNPNAIPGVKVDVNPPRPVVVTTRADNGKTGLFKLRTTVYATIQNQGGEGDVFVKFLVHQGGNEYERSKSIYMQPNESVNLDVTFDEVRVIDGKISYDVQVKSE